MSNFKYKEGINGDAKKLKRFLTKMKAMLAKVDIWKQMT